MLRLQTGTRLQSISNHCLHLQPRISNHASYLQPGISNQASRQQPSSNQASYLQPSSSISNQASRPQPSSNHESATKQQPGLISATRFYSIRAWASLEWLQAASDFRPGFSDQAASGFRLQQIRLCGGHRRGAANKLQRGLVGDGWRGCWRQRGAAGLLFSGGWRLAASADRASGAGEMDASGSGVGELLAKIRAELWGAGPAALQADRRALAAKRKGWRGVGAGGDRSGQ